jgi:alpha-beta hydrolase superfamily lysophospholipase
MTPRQFRIGGLVLSAAFAILGIWALAEAKYGSGTLWLVMSVAWVLLASFRNNTLRAQERRRQRLEAKYASQPIPAQPDNLPRWFSPDNPPGWYLNPATNEPAYWSEIGWRSKEPSAT